MPQHPIAHAADASVLSKKFSLRQPLYSRCRTAVPGKRSRLARVPALLPLLLRSHHAHHSAILATAVAALHRAQLQTAVNYPTARRGAACRCMDAAPLATADVTASGPAVSPPDSGGCAAALNHLTLASNVGTLPPCTGRPTLANGTASVALPSAAAAVCRAAPASRPAGPAPATKQPQPSQLLRAAEPPDALPSSQSPALRFEVPTDHALDV